MQFRLSTHEQKLPKMDEHKYATLPGKNLNLLLQTQNTHTAFARPFEKNHSSHKDQDHKTTTPRHSVVSPILRSCEDGSA